MFRCHKRTPCHEAAVTAQRLLSTSSSVPPGHQDPSDPPPTTGVQVRSADLLELPWLCSWRRCWNLHLHSRFTFLGDEIQFSSKASCSFILFTFPSVMCKSSALIEKLLHATILQHLYLSMYFCLFMCILYNLYIKYILFIWCMNTFYMIFFKTDLYTCVHQVHD